MRGLRLPFGCGLRRIELAAAPLGSNLGRFDSASGSFRHKKTPLGGAFLCLARPEGFEPPTAWFVARYSIQLSYGRVQAEYYVAQFCRGQPRFCDEK